MKKTIILITLMALMTTMVFAQQEPTSITDIGTISAPGFIDANTNFHKLCVEANTQIICSGVWQNDWPYDMPISYADYQNPDNGLVLIIEYTSSPANDLYNEQDCYYYETNGRIYCMGHEGGGTYDVYSFLPTGADDQDHANLVGFQTSNVYSSDLRPGTDEIYMFSGKTGTAINPAVWMYDIGDDTWTHQTNITVNGYWGEGQNCFITEDGAEMVCIGGRDNVGSERAEFMVYDIVAKTYSFYPYYAVESTQYGRWINGILYLVGGEDSTGAPQDEIFYIDSSDWSYGTLTTTLPVPLEWVIIGAQGDKDYVFGGYTTGSAQNLDVYEIDWTVPVVEEEVTTTTSGDNTAGNLAYIQNIQKAKAAQSKQAALNPIEQFILNLRATILRLFGHEV